MSEHIKIPDAAPIVRLIANGTQTTYAYDFPIFASEDLDVSLNGTVLLSGYDVTGAGQTNGGIVDFDQPPPSGTIITLARRLAFERLTDFIEGGDFAANALNSELDYLVAGLQQVASDQTPMVRFPPDEVVTDTYLPARAERMHKALGFDGEGRLTAVSLAGSMAEPMFIQNGTGAIQRSSTDKLRERVSVKDFGALGDGINDDTAAFRQALAASSYIFIPTGTYLIRESLTLTDHQTLEGVGDASRITTVDHIALIHVSGSYNRIANLKIFGGSTGILFKGRNGPCVQNTVTDIGIWQAQTGLMLDGGTDTNKPVYWNNFARILVAQPFVQGIFLTRSGAGDTPNANRFHQCRVYSLGATTTGHGIYIEHGSFNNSFIDCEVNVNGTAQSCVCCGAGSNKTLFVNLYTESFNTVPNVKLMAGSIETAITNLFSASDGAAIWDLSGGQYTAHNAGYPYKNRLQRTICNDLTTTLARYDTEYIDSSGIVTLDLSHSVHLVSSYGGALTVNVPLASAAAGVMMMIKKIDTSKNSITVAESGGVGPDGAPYTLGGQNDYVMMVSNGAKWFVMASNRSPGNTRYYDGTGLYNIDLAVDVYLLSSYAGSMTAQLPPANAAKAIGRRVTIKKTDVSSNPITLTVQGGSGPDNYNQVLSAQFQAITVVSDGGAWHIIARF